MALQEELEKQGNWLFKYRSFLPLLPLFIATILFLRREILPGKFILEDTAYERYYEMFAVFVSLIGVFIRVFTIGYVAKNTSGRNTFEGQKADSLNTKGIYSIVRHPLYLGNFLMWMGLALWSANYWFIIAFCLFYWIYYERIMFSEEQYLRRKFGDEYLNWAKKTPAFLPKFKNYKKINRSFNWRKALIQEKNGIFALFLIFSFFDVFAEILEKGYNFNYGLLIITLIAGLNYLVFKYIKKRVSAV